MALSLIPLSAASTALLIAVPVHAGSFASAPPAQKSATHDEGQAIAEADLRSLVDDEAVRTIYDAAGWKPLWSEGSAQALDKLLAQRAQHGLDRVAIAVDAESGAGPAKQEIARTKTALRYAAALAKGSVDPAALHDPYTLPRPEGDIGAGLAKAVSDGTLAEWFDSLAPQNAEYRQLSEAYVRYRNAASDANGDEIAGSGLIRVGDEDERVPAIVERLRDNDYLAAATSDAQSTTYTQATAQAVEQLQRDHGIAVDGIIGPDTLQLLNRGPADRVRALAVALERRRWLARSPASTRIDVNVAAARQHYFRDGDLVDSRKVIVGKPGNETPALMSPIYRLVANPTWTVPKSIQNSELADVGQDYLDSHNMEMRDGWIVQQSGPDNALGLVKFDMINDHAIYLHDTSARELLGRSLRQLSHGCVRVDDAIGFARLLAEHQGISEEWEAARQSGEQTFVPLQRQIPVRLLYHNVFVDEAGSLAFRTDPYRWNDGIAAALGFAKAGVEQHAKAERADIGP
jgi:murein L,D-transpeptidase YcbB/YkuD